MTEKRFTLSETSLIDKYCIEDNGKLLFQKSVVDLLNQLHEENEKLKQQLAYHTRMHEWFRNEAYLLQNKLDNREDEIRRLKGDMDD